MTGREQGLLFSGICLHRHRDHGPAILGVVAAHRGEHLVVHAKGGVAPRLFLGRLGKRQTDVADGLEEARRKIARRHGTTGYG